jgi:pre-mRNA-splicing factor SYF1
MFNIYIQKAASLYGVTKTRPIFEAALEALSDSDARQMGIRFAELETKLGEIDRARAIFAHTSQICDPRVKLSPLHILTRLSLFNMVKMS